MGLFPARDQGLGAGWLLGDVGDLGWLGSVSGQTEFLLEIKKVIHCAGLFFKIFFIVQSLSFIYLSFIMSTL